MNMKVDPDWWKKLFDEIYLLTDARSVCDEDITRREVDLICELIPLRPDDRILDLCGGQGRHSHALSKRGFNGCTVLDFSQVLIDLGRATAVERGCNINFLRADARSTGLPSSGFDHVMIVGNSLGYLPDPEGDRQIFTEAFRVLKPGGWFLVDIADSEAVKRKFNPIAWHEIGEDIMVCRQRELKAEKLRTREIVISKKNGLIRDKVYSIRVYSPEKLKALFSQAGFGSISVHKKFSPHGKKGDYGFMNSRVILTARKPLV